MEKDFPCYFIVSALVFLDGTLFQDESSGSESDIEEHAHRS